MDIEYGKIHYRTALLPPRQGYLSGDYQLFHLDDSGPRDFRDPHYHDFCKIWSLISGSVRTTS